MTTPTPTPTPTPAPFRSKPEPRKPLLAQTATFPLRPATTLIIVHCAATPAGRDHTAAELEAWHLARGFKALGYHFVIKLDGTVVAGRPVGSIGAHAEGRNSTAVGICYIGGLATDAKTPQDTRTPAQKAALLKLLTELKARYPAAAIIGHRDVAAKACPSFDAKTEYRNITAATPGAAK